MVPNPDYWMMISWKNLIGDRILGIQDVGSQSALDDAYQGLFCHVFCAREEGVSGASKGDVTLLLVNIGNEGTSHSAKFAGVEDLTTAGKRSKFLVQVPAGEELSSRQIQLNGINLEMESGGELPPILASVQSNSQLVNVPPYSIMFVVLHGVSTDACMPSDQSGRKGNNRLQYTIYFSFALILLSMLAFLHKRRGSGYKGMSSHETLSSAHVEIPPMPSEII